MPLTDHGKQYRGEGTDRLVMLLFRHEDERRRGNFDLAPGPIALKSLLRTGFAHGVPDLRPMPDITGRRPDPGWPRFMSHGRSPCSYAQVSRLSPEVSGRNIPVASRSSTTRAVRSRSRS
jgi:hypothetical protein